MARSALYTVSGPGLDPEPTYDSDGPAMSRSQTAALAAKVEGTWYARNPQGDTVAYSERDEHGGVTTRRIG